MIDSFLQLAAHQWILSAFTRDFSCFERYLTTRRNQVKEMDCFGELVIFTQCLPA